MPIPSYANASITSNNTIVDLYNLVNDIASDMATTVVTSANGSLAGTFLYVEDSIRGGNSTVSAILNVSSNVAITGTLGVSGQANLANDLIVGGVGYFTNLETSNTLYVDGVLRGGNTSTSANLSITTNADISGVLNVSNNVSVTGNTLLTGTTTFVGNVATTSANTSINSTNIQVINTTYTFDGGSAVVNASSTYEFNTPSMTINANAIYLKGNSVSIDPILSEVRASDKIIELTGNTSPISVDVSLGNHFVLVLEEDTTINFDTSGLSGFSASEAWSWTLEVIQDSGGNQYTLTISNGNVSYPYDITPTLSTDANKKDYIVYATSDQGNTITGIISGQDI